jgi:hypothetical protein
VWYLQLLFSLLPPSSFDCYHNMKWMKVNREPPPDIVADRCSPICP